MNRKTIYTSLGIVTVAFAAVFVATCAAPPGGGGGSQAPDVVISPKRPMQVAGKQDPYAANDTHNPKSIDWDYSGERRGFTIKPEGALGWSRVSMKGPNLRTIYIGEAIRVRDSDSVTVTIVAGAYTPLPDNMTQASVLPIAEMLAKSWECIWCAKEEVMVCGVEPQCEDLRD